MRKTLVAFTAIALLSGCKVTDKALSSGENPQNGGGIGPIVNPKERNFTASELVIGRRICGALKKKRELFEVLTNMQEKFRFKGELKNCESEYPHNINDFNASISNASSTDFEYVSIYSIYFRDVVTDKTGVMRTYCDAITGSDSVSNQILSGNSYIRMNLLISDGYDRVEIVKMDKNSKILSTEGMNIITQKTQADAKFFGVEKERVLYTACANSDKVNYTKQTWISAITPF